MWRKGFIAIALCAQTGGVHAAPATGTAPPESTGTIVGQVVETGRTPVPYASVTLRARSLGVATDEKGRFRLARIPAGIHVVHAQQTGFVVQGREVLVRPGETTTLDFTLEPRVSEVPEIEVVGRKPIDVKTSQTTQAMTGTKLQELPVDNVMDAVGTMAGVVVRGENVHVRGGRPNEVKMRIDGAEASDPLLDRNANVATLAVDGFELISGGFDAEYGNALSAIVNVTTREGGDRFAGTVRWDTDRFGDPTKTFDHYDRFTVGFGGPTPIRHLTYFATYEGTFQDTYLASSWTRPSATFLDFISTGNRQSNHVNTNLKLAYRGDSKNKMTFEAIRNRTIVTPYDHMWSRKGYVKTTMDTVRRAGLPDHHRPVYGAWSATAIDSTYQPMNMPDHVPTTDDTYRQFSAAWTHQASRLTVVTTRLSTIQFSTLQSVGRKQPWEFDTQSPQYWSGNVGVGEDNPYFATHGDYPVYSSRDARTWSLKSDLATQHWQKHSVKTGIEARYNRVQNLTLSSPNTETNGLPGATRSEFTNFNPEGSAYLQDRWEYEGLVLNAGIRYDFFAPGEQIGIADLPSGRRYKQQFSPRLGVAHPISDKDALSFHYGWTYQVPARQYIFENRHAGANVPALGNPDLEPETNVAYQASIQHLFSRDVSGQFSVFFRDIFGLITARPAIDAYGNPVAVYGNGDYASSRGFEAGLAKAFSHKFSASLNYTFALASGVASNPNDALQFINGNQLYLPISEQALDWDQRHTLSFSATVRDAAWGFRVLWEYGSGVPFTPAFPNDRRPDPRLTNAGRLPSSSSLTIDGDKFFRMWGQSLRLFVDARNILNARNIAALEQGTFPNPYVGAADYAIYYSQTGRAGGAYRQDTNGDNVLDWVPLHDPRVFEEGRRVRLGAAMTF
jgi:outer membrane receptor protein involved in Fe transport